MVSATDRPRGTFQNRPATIARHTHVVGKSNPPRQKKQLDEKCVRLITCCRYTTATIESKGDWWESNPHLMRVSMESNSAVQLCLETGSFADLVKSVRRSVLVNRSPTTPSQHDSSPKVTVESALPCHTRHRNDSKVRGFFLRISRWEKPPPTSPHPQAAWPRRPRHDEGRVGLVPPVRWRSPAKRRPREAQSTPNPDSPPTTRTPKPHGHAVHGTTTVGSNLSRPSTGHRRPKDDRGRHSCRPGTPRMRWIHPSSLTPFSDHCIAHRTHIPCPPNCRLAWPGDSWCSPQSRHVPAC